MTALRFPGPAARIWIVQGWETVAGLDPGARPLRFGMLVNELLDRGHEVVWWNSTFHHNAKRHRFRGSRSVELSSGLTLHLLHGRPAYRRNVSPARWLHQRSIAGAFTEAAASAAPPDVIVTNIPTLELCEAAIQYGGVHHVPVIVDIADPWPDVYLTALPSGLRGTARHLLGPSYRRLTRIFAGASAVTAISDAYLRWAMDHGAATVPLREVFSIGHQRWVGPGAGPGEAPKDIRARYGIPPRAHIAVFSGTFGRSYDLDTVVECARLLEHERPGGVHFVLAGTGDRVRSLQRRSARLSNLTLTGWLDERALEALLASASLGLCAYAPDATQTLPTKCFEYMAAGLPQVSSLPGELADLVRSYGLGAQYEAGHAASLGAAIVSLLDAPATREQMGRNARAIFNQRFDAARIYPSMAAVVESLALGDADRLAAGASR